jgi:hypothetical protein
MREPVRTLKALWERLAFARMNPRRHIRFGLYSTVEGLIGGHSQNTGLCCDMWNMRNQIEVSVRLTEALRQHPEHLVRLTSGSCTCMTKAPEAAFHKPDCVYGAARAVMDLLESGTYAPD